MSEKTIALLGQPNSGKSSLFNGLTKIPPIKSLIFRELIACLQIRMKKLLHGIT